VEAAATHNATVEAGGAAAPASSRVLPDTADAQTAGQGVVRQFPRRPRGAAEPLGSWRYRVFVHHSKLDRPLQLDDLYVAAAEVRPGQIVTMPDRRQVLVQEVRPPTAGFPGLLTGRPFLGR
jgi:hypothetical protein